MHGFPAFLRQGAALGAAPIVAAVALLLLSSVAATAGPVREGPIALKVDAKALASGDPPSPRAGPSMAYGQYSANESGMLLFGGFNSNGILGDTWRMHYGHWKQLHPPTRAPPRAWAVMDNVGGALIMFGGRGVHGLLGDTWQFHNGTWHLLHPAVSPPARSNASFAGGILFGGQGAKGNLADTWTFANGQWKQLFPAHAPSARNGAAMTVKPTPGGSEVLLFGGRDASGYLGDTWAYRSTVHDWVRLVEPVAPSARADAGLSTWFGWAQLYGGTNGHPINNAWKFESNAWTEVPRSAPSGRYSFAFTPGIGNTPVLFGGEGPPGVYYNDTIIF
jgi:hypothetical protein